MKKCLKISIATGSIVMAGTTLTALAGTVPDFTQHGFPTVVASAQIPANSTSSTTLKADGATFTIPAGFSSDPVKFEVVQGKLSTFAKMAPTGQTPIYDFAFKVLDTKTNSLLGAFTKPVVFSYTNANINSKSMYYNISTSGAYTANPKSMAISGDTMTHNIAGAPVGWAITSPSSVVSKTTSPTTGLPLKTWLLTGIGLLLVGGVLFAVRRRIS